MPSKNGTMTNAADFNAFVDDVMLWKLAGAAAWSTAACLAGLVLHALSWPPPASGVFSVASCMLILSVLLVVYCQRRNMAAMDVPPLHVQALGLPHSAWLPRLFSRCLLRTRKAPDVANAALMYAACAASGCIGVWGLGAPSKPEHDGTAGASMEAAFGVLPPPPSFPFPAYTSPARCAWPANPAADGCPQALWRPAGAFPPTLTRASHSFCGCSCALAAGLRRRPGGGARRRPPVQGRQRAQVPYPASITL